MRERACGGFGHRCTGTRGGRACSAPSPPPPPPFRGPPGVVLGFPLTSKKDVCPSPTPARAATCLCRGDLFSHDPAVPRVLREWRGRGAEPVGDRGVGGGAVPRGGASGEGPGGNSVTQVGSGPRPDACEKGGASPETGMGLAARLGSPPRGRRLAERMPHGSGSWECERKVVPEGLKAQRRAELSEEGSWKST